MGLFSGNKKKEEQNVKAASLSHSQASEKAAENVVPTVSGDFAFVIQECFALKESGCVVAGMVIIGTVKKGEMVLYSDIEGSIGGECVITGIEQGKEKMEQASADQKGTYGQYFAFMLPGTDKSKVRQGDLLISPSMLLNNRLKEIPTIFRQARQANLPEYKLSDDRKNELVPILIQPEIANQDIADLSIQEVTFLICAIRAMNEKAPIDGFEAKEQLLLTNAIHKIKEASSLFLTVDKLTGFPFLNQGRVDIYSKKEFAMEAVEFFKQQYRDLEVKKIKKEKTGLPNDMGLFQYLYCLGMEQVNIDNGQYLLELTRSEILPPPEYAGINPASIPVLNPNLRFSMLDFFQELRWKVNYKERENVLKVKEQAMIEAICKAKFLAPMKHEGEVEQVDGGIRFKEGGKMMFAKLSNTENQAFIPVFSDWTEFDKVYDRKEWTGAIVSIVDAIHIGNGDGIAINPFGENMLLNQKNMAMIQEDYKKYNSEE